MLNIEMYTNGDYQSSFNKGYWSVLILGDQVQNLNGTESNTTDIRMKLTAIVEGLKALDKPSKVWMYTDFHGINNNTIKQVSKNNKDIWRIFNNISTKNKDLQLELHELVQKHKIVWN